jgi:hypothetical protein
LGVLKSRSYFLSAVTSFTVLVYFFSNVKSTWRNFLIYLEDTLCTVTMAPKKQEVLSSVKGLSEVHSASHSYCVMIYIYFASWFVFSKAHGLRTSPQCRARLVYPLVLSPLLFQECPHHEVLTNTCTPYVVAHFTSMNINVIMNI